MAQVLRLVKVDHHHDVAGPDRSPPDLDQQLGEGGVRLGALAAAPQAQGQPRHGDRLDLSQQGGDPLLAGDSQPGSVGEVQQRGGHPLDRIGAGGDPQLGCHPVPRRCCLVCDPPHQRGLAGARLAQDRTAPFGDAGQAARAQDVVPVAELRGTTGPDLRDGVRARAKRRIERRPHLDKVISASQF